MIITNFGTLLTSNLTPKRLHIKLFMPDSPNPTMRESQSLFKFGQVSLKNSIEELEFAINMAVFKTDIPIHYKGTQKFPTQALIDRRSQA